MSVYFTTVLLALLFSQGIKVVVAFLTGHQDEWKLALLRSGGMPSAHSSLVVSMAVVVGIVEGTGSAVFALSVVLAIIVMYDALNVRRSVGEQGTAIKRLIAELKLASEGYVYKQADGHHPLEVLAGILTGVMAALASLYLS